MEEVMKMLRAIINAQSSMDEKLNKLDKKIDNLDIKLTKRIDTLGLDLAYLEDDAPTRKEH